MDPARLPGRWIVIADSPFLPARGGGEREHLGFVEAASAAGLVAAVVVPTDDDPAALGRSDDLGAIRDLIAPAPLIPVPRRRAVTAALGRHPYVVASRPAPGNLVADVRRAAPDADAVVVFSYKVHEIGRVLATGLGLPAVLRQHNLEGPYHRALAASARTPRSWLVAIEAARVDADERRLERAPWLSGIADISAADARVRSARASVPVRHVPSFALGPRSGAAQPAWAGASSRLVVFVGSLEVGTNLDAVTWFADEVWPTVLRHHPDARWQIVGRRPSAAVHALVRRTPGAELHADVADPSVYLRQAAVAVNPAVSGSGVNIKLVEYLSVGVPVVSTTKGTDGLGLHHGIDLLVADTGREFADATGRLLDGPETAAVLGEHGRQTALRILDVDTSLDQLAALLHRA